MQSCFVMINLAVGQFLLTVLSDSLSLQGEWDQPLSEFLLCPVQGGT